MSGDSALHLEQDIREALENGDRELRELDVSVPVQGLVRLTLALVRQRSPERALTSIEKLRQDLAAVDAVLRRIYEKGRAAERTAAEEEPLGPAWMSDMRRRLNATAQAEDWLTRWVDVWAQALTVSRWDRCREIAALQPPTEPQPARLADARQDLTAIVDALDQQDVTESLLVPIRSLLTLPGLTPACSTAVLVLESRLLRRFVGDLAGAGRAADEAIGLNDAQEGPLTSLAVVARVARAEVALDAGDLPAVHEQLDALVLLGEPASPDTLVLAGRLAAREGSFDLADDCYDAAALHFPADATAGHLLRETPPNLMWRAAGNLATTEPERALRLLDAAIDGGIEGTGRSPERRAVRDRAQLLELMGDHDRAAAAYADAASLYAGRGRALKLLQRAVELAPDEAPYRFELGEALRAAGIVADGEVDVTLLRSAKAHLDRGFAIRPPRPREAWALVTAALVDDALQEGPDPALSVERALLLEPRYAAGLAFLSLLLSAWGYPSEAADTAQRAFALDPRDVFVIQQQARCLSDSSRYQEALKLLDRKDVEQLQLAELKLVRTLVLLRMGLPRPVLDALEGVDESGDSRLLLVRSWAHALRDETEPERRVLQSLSERLADSHNVLFQAWVAHRLGRLDEAITLLQDSFDHGGGGKSLESDLGQLLLARGSDHDVAAGAEHLLRGVERITDIDALVHLDTLELHLLLTSVKGRPQEAQVSEIVATARHQIALRIEQLRSQQRPAGEVAVRLARAREALADEDVDRALSLYVELVRGDGPPETERGLVRATTAVVEHADAEAAAGKVADAGARWRAVLDAAETMGDEGLVQRMRARLGLAAVELDGSVSEETVRALRNCTGEALTEAFRLLGRDVPTLWALRDALLAVAARPGVPLEQVRILEAAAASAPLDAVYASDRVAVPSKLLSPYVNAVEVVLGTAYSGLLASETLKTDIPRLRNQLAQQHGLRIPGVTVRIDESIPADRVRFLVYGLIVRDDAPPAGAAPHSSARILGAFEHMLLDNLFRWMSLDDLDLWASGWDVLDPNTEELAEELPDGLRPRLRLTRVLRMLLREGVPVADRRSIVDGFLEADARHGGTAYSSLAEVRRRLYPATLGPRAEPVWDVPEALQDRLAAGLAADGAPIWSLPRPAARELVADLRRWRGTLPDGPVAIRVQDVRLRPFVWRLLASDRPRIYVTSLGEQR